MFICAHAPIFAMRGGGQCYGHDTGPGGQCEGRSVGCLGSSDCSRDASWFCSVPCDGNSSSGSSAAGNGGSRSGSNGSSNSSTQSSQSGPDWSISAQELKGRIEAECYVAPNGQICTKAQLIQASEELVRMSEGLAQGRTNVVVSWVAKDIASRLFDIDTVSLGCAVAERAPAERCKTLARIKQLAAEIKRSEANIQQLEADIKKLDAESARIQKEIDLRMQRHMEQSKFIKQRLKDGGLFN